MSSLISTQHMLIAVTVTFACAIIYANCSIQITGGSGPFSVYREMACNVVVDGNTSANVPRIMSCARLCTEESSCSVAHYNDNSSTCMVDTRLANTLVVDASPGDSFWTSYLRYQFTCDSNWTQLDKSCYHVPSDIHRWTECQTYCQIHSSHLATIRSDREMAFALGIIEILGHQFLHIGGKRNPDNTWSWINGEPWDFTRWYPYEPSNFTEKCVSIFPKSWVQYDWNDLPCTYMGYCLCEKSVDVHFIEPPSPCMPNK